ncbi:MAG: hypothetical protein ACRYG4_21175 [Janthinobacterium lividum]
MQIEHMPPMNRNGGLDGWLIALGLGYLSCCGLVYANFITVTVQGYESVLHLSPQLAGTITSSNLIGGAVGTLLAVIAGNQASRKLTAVACLLGIVILDVLSPLVVAPYALIALRGLHGVLAGSMMGFTARLLAATSMPERAASLSLLLQASIYAVSVYVMPSLLAKMGMAAIFGSMAGLEAVGLLVIALIPVDQILAARTQNGQFTEARPKFSFVALLACGAYALYEFARFLIVGFAFNMADAFAIPIHFVGLTMAMAGGVSAVAALTAAIIGIRFGRATVILSVMALRTVFSLAIMATTGHQAAFAIIVCAQSFFSVLLLPYFWGTCLALDRSGRLAVATSFIGHIGLGMGPMIGGIIINGYGFVTLLIVSTLLGVVSAFLALMPARLTDAERQRENAMTTLPGRNAHEKLFDIGGEPFAAHLPTRT